MSTAILGFFILAGGLSFLCGCMVRFRRKLEFLALYDPRATRDKKGLARWAGNNLMVMGCLQIACGVAGLVAGQLIWAGLAFVACTILITIILALGTAEYSKNSI